ncbi:MAG: hypothetical protein LBS90_03860 [Oscillospiraceae bacterium]|jgi:hypothetical protein|nr:hypothetical protein [Oscillospiraceae bacterium]
MAVWKEEWVHREPDNPVMPEIIGYFRSRRFLANCIAITLICLIALAVTVAGFVQFFFLKRGFFARVFSFMPVADDPMAYDSVRLIIAAAPTVFCLLPPVLTLAGIWKLYSSNFKDNAESRLRSLEIVRNALTMTFILCLVSFFAVQGFTMSDPPVIRWTAVIFLIPEFVFCGVWTLSLMTLASRLRQSLTLYERRIFCAPREVQYIFVAGVLVFSVLAAITSKSAIWLLFMLYAVPLNINLDLRRRIFPAEKLHAQKLNEPLRKYFNRDVG